MNSELQIGEVAKRSGVSIDTLRYYEKLKLLPPTRRSSGGFRLFAPEHVERVQFIKQAQELGFSLDEIKGLLATGGAEECRKVRDLLKTKLNELDEQLKKMKRFRSTMARHLLACEKELKTQGEAAECPVIVEIERPSRKRRRLAKGRKYRK
ncbi:MAG: heavy metal-responsive transcriptional regulator [Pyrinomonadaceae bacterium]